MVDTLTCKHGNLTYISTTRQRGDIPRQQLVFIPNAWNKSYYRCTTTYVNRWLHLEGPKHNNNNSPRKSKERRLPDKQVGKQVPVSQQSDNTELRFSRPLKSLNASEQKCALLLLLSWRVSCWS